MPAPHLSPSEQHLHKLLGRRPQTTGVLAVRYYGRKVPENGRVVISALARALERKTRRQRPRVRRSKRAGPYSISVWLA